VQATSSTLLITGGLAAHAQSAATANTSTHDEDKVTLSEVLTYEKCFGSCNPSFSQLRQVDAIEGEKDEAIASTN
ncbi:hypothetical protein Tco_1388770, partial [Tanacetum coccineum]